MARQIISPHFGNRIVYAFRMTHIDNIPHVIDKGFVLPTSPDASPYYVNIGDSSVIAKRKEQIIHGYNLADFIPFYFGPRSPMLYVIQCGGNGVTQRNPEEIVYCVIKISDLISDKIKGVYTDGHALDELSSFFPLDRLQEVDCHVSVNDVFETYWKDNETDIDLKRRKEAELLIEKELPAKYIAGLIVFSDDAKIKLQNIGITKKIIVCPTFYF